ncbi:sugar ABC transporter ATP-binding protein [soil metagenome]
MGDGGPPDGLSPVVLSVEGVAKSYGDARVLAIDDLQVRAGEVHALLGENGAGKSTLTKIVAGVVTPDRGRVTLAGRTLRLGSPRAAMTSGVSTLFQELATVPGLTVAENVFLGRAVPSRWGVVRWAALERAANELFEGLGQSIDVRLDVERLSAVERTMTALARALSQESRLLVLDEPTAALTEAETTEVFAVIRRLRSRGVAILYVSHRLEEVFSIADRYTVLRNGRRVSGGDVRDTTVSNVIASMAGRPIDAVFPSWTSAPGAVLLEVDGLTGRQISDVSLVVRAGEVLGIAGLAGSGRSELLRILVGASPSRAGRILLEGRPFAPGSPGKAHRNGVALVPQERRSQGLIPDTVERNLNASTIDRHALGSLLMRPRRERSHARSLWQEFHLRGRGPHQDVLTLSGGNQQKVVLARTVALRPRLLLLDEPTRGVDVSTKSEIYRLIRAQAAAGRAVIIVSSELPEIMGLSDRIIVLHEGRVSGRVDRGALTEEGLLHLCYGRPA